MQSVPVGFLGLKQFMIKLISTTVDLRKSNWAIFTYESLLKEI